ncbi:hypothetical protein ACC684_39685, partial [Rhizobium ruizarguesonis]
MQLALLVSMLFLLSFFMFPELTVKIGFCKTEAFTHPAEKRIGGCGKTGLWVEVCVQRHHGRGWGCGLPGTCFPADR